MNSYHILLVTITEGAIDSEKIETKLNGARDWLRYAPGCWLIQTKQSANVWNSRLLDVVDLDSSLLFICEVNLEDRAGRLSPDAWAWIKKVRLQTKLVAS